MPKKPSTPLEQTARLLDLVPFLLTHQGISIEDLSSFFKVDKEVMIDDLNTLWMCGLPGYTPLELIDINFDSGYVTIRNAAPLARIRSMSSSEIISLILGLDILRENSASFSEENRAKIDDLRSLLRSQVNIFISVTDRSTSSHRSTISHAIASRSSIEIDYFSPTTDSQSKRVITPFHFFEDNGIEYLQAHCHMAGANRTFRIDRIAGSTIVDIDNPVEMMAADVKTKIRALVTVHQLDRATIERFGLVEGDAPLGSSLPVEAFSAEWLIRAIMETDSGLEIEEPAGLRQMMEKRINAAIALYE